MSHTLTIAIPAYNEESSLSSVVDEAISSAKKLALPYEILIVDDGSTDTTGAIADKLAKIHAAVRVIHHPKNQGFTGAIKTCYRKASKNFIFLVPADGQVKVSDLPKFYEAIQKSDIAVGYRLNTAEPLYRQLNSWLFHIIYRLFFGIVLKDIATAIMWKKSVLDSLSITSDPGSAMIELEVIYKAWKKGYKFSEVGIRYFPRTGGKPKGANPFMIIKTLKEILRHWWKLRILSKK